MSIDIGIGPAEIKRPTKKNPGFIDRNCTSGNKTRRKESLRRENSWEKKRSKKVSCFF